MKRPLLVFLTVFLIPVIAYGQISDPVQTKAGLMSGKSGTDASVNVYLGIPFAAPPVGDLRWAAPRAVDSWDGVRAADAMPPACIQHVAGSRLPWTEEFMHQGEISEDCLYLNIWTAAYSADEKRPVMVYIYGGGFNEGSNAVAVYDGEELAKKGVVLVGINYRVGVLGFLAHPELTEESEHKASGNYGLLDQVAALQWIQENIAAFGGDPENVTVFGQSAGGMSVAMLMHSHLSKGLFARAIIQSGPGLFSVHPLFGVTPLSNGEDQGTRFAEAIGGSSLAQLRALTPEELNKPVQGVGRFGPVADGYFLSADNPNTDQVPVMNGFTADDFGTNGSLFGPPPEATVVAFESDARRLYGEKADAFLSYYSASSDADVAALRTMSGRDRARVSLHLWGGTQREMSDAVYTYFFDRAIPWPDHPEFGAFHTGEVPYIFDNLRVLDRPWEAVDHTVADRMSMYWVNFAKTGDPNGDGLATWMPYTPDEIKTHRIGAEMGAMPISDSSMVAFWKESLMDENGGTSQ